jgi:N6-L-threonylcarbamoyladenine synthase
MSNIHRFKTILAIESSCDETSACILKNGTEIINSVTASSSNFHEITGGIVPEIAARKQVEFIVPVLEELFVGAQKLYGKSREEIVSEIDAIAVTYGPGLIGSLIVGVNAAKALSLAWNKPLIPVNHLIGHVYSTFLEYSEEITFPSVVLVVSGGHTDLVLMKGHGNYEYLGGTLDDAAGEAFDKTARLLGISSYKLGGALLSKKASECKNITIKGKLPRPMLDKQGYDFSFSGLKTSVKYFIQKNPNVPVEEVAAEFENAVVDVLIAKTLKAIEEYNVKSVLIGGGVAANTNLRGRLLKLGEDTNVNVFVPKIAYCGDTSEYIACAAYYNPITSESVSIKANPSLSILS